MKALNIALAAATLFMAAQSSIAGAQASAGKTIALTFDDLPVSTIGQDPSAAAKRGQRKSRRRFLPR